MLRIPGLALLAALLATNVSAQVVGHPESFGNGTLSAQSSPGPNLQNTSNVVVCSDVAEQVLLRQIDQYRQLLKKTTFSAESHGFQEIGLKDLEGHFARHLLQVQSNAAANLSDPIEQSLSSQVACYERELDNPGIEASRNKALQQALVDFTKMRDAHRREVRLWANLAESRGSKDLRQTALAEQALADHLAKKLGRIQGKTYPADMSFDGVMAEYTKTTKDPGGNHPIIRGVILLTVLVPALIMAFIPRQKLFSKRRG